MSDDTTTTDDRRTDIQPDELKAVGEFVAHVREHPGATVDEYDVAVDMWDDTEVELSVTLTDPTEQFQIQLPEGDTVSQLVKERIESLEADHDDGAPIATVTDPLEYNAEVTADELTDALERLRTVGEVYEPVADHLRVV